MSFIQPCVWDPSWEEIHSCWADIKKRAQLRFVLPDSNVCVPPLRDGISLSTPDYEKWNPDGRDCLVLGGKEGANNTLTKS